MRLEKSLGDEDRLEKSFSGEVKSGKIMVDDDEWWMAMFVWQNLLSYRAHMHLSLSDDL